MADGSCRVGVCGGAAPPSVALAAGVVSADAGDWYSTAVLSDGTLWGWGYNAQGQLGDGTLATHLSPSKVGTETTWASVNAGYRHTLALKADGSLWAWGWNKDGQLGIGHAENTFVPDHWHSVPSQVGTSTAWMQVSAGFDHSVALDASGTIWAWGANDFGQLGDGSTEPTAGPMPVSTSPGPGLHWRRVWADEFRSLALSSDGALWEWGIRTDSIPTMIDFIDLEPPATDLGWWTVSPARDHLSATFADSSLWTWKTEPGFGQHFVGYEFLDIAETRDTVNTGGETGLLIAADHSLWVTTNEVGTPVPLLDPDTDEVAPRLYIVGNALNWTKLSAGRNHFLVAKSDGSLWGWGYNTFGQLGDGTETNHSFRTSEPVRTILPTPIPNVTGMTQSDAEDKIEEMGFKVGTPVTLVATTAVEVTRIVSQTPASDTLVLPGGYVFIVVSAGPPVIVPNVVGMQETDARVAIGDAGLGVSTVTQAYSSIVPIGAVISHSPVAGTPVIIASKVSLVVSKGREPKIIPYTNGRTESQARSTLTANGFVAGVTRKEYSTIQAAGMVTRTNPPAGQLAFKGDVVDLYVSLGKPKPTVGNPVAPSRMRRGRYYTVYGSLKPRHTSGSYPVRIYKYKKTSSGSYRSYGYVTAKVSNYSSYSRYAKSLKLSYTGKWRLRAYAPADSAHAAAWSSGYDYVTVR